MNFDAFGAIRISSQPANLFFNHDWPLRIAQASGCMYPAWALATIYPLYLGLNSVLPCALLAYGLCVVGGNLHSGFAFATILPQIYHNHENDEHHAFDLHSTLQFAQSKVMDCYVFGYTPGPLAIMVASGWIMYLVITKRTKFPRRFALFTPLVTVAWISFVGFQVLPWPYGFYLVGTFGTWIILVMNAAVSWSLWNVDTEITLQLKEKVAYREKRDWQ